MGWQTNVIQLLRVRGAETMQTIIHNLGLVTICYLAFAAVLILELLIAAKIDKRKTRSGNRPADVREANS